MISYCNCLVLVLYKFQVFRPKNWNPKFSPIILKWCAYIAYPKIALILVKRSPHYLNYRMILKFFLFSNWVIIAQFGYIFLWMIPPSFGYITKLVGKKKSLGTQVAYKTPIMPKERGKSIYIFKALYFTWYYYNIKKNSR